MNRRLFLITSFILLFCLAGTTSVERYTVGPNDLLEIAVWQHDDLFKEVRVSPDGYIAYPFIGYFKVSGMTIDELTNFIKSRLKEYIIDPEVTVIVKEYQSHKVYILGAVKNPGFIPLLGGESVLEAILRSGGFDEKADITKINVIDKNGQKKIVNIEKFITGEDIKQNIALKTGDVVYVPERAFLPKIKGGVFLFGAVAKPGFYEYSEGMKILDLISQAGNPSYQAVLNSTKIIRGSLDNPEIINVRLKNLIRQGDFNENYELRPGDIVYVPTRLITNINRFIGEFTPILSAINSIYFTKNILLPSTK